MRSAVAADLPSLWTRADFPNEAAWSFDLSDNDRQALITYGRGGASQADLARQFGCAVARWLDLLNNGPGFLRLRNFPIDSLTGPEIEHAYLGLGTLLGRPVGQDRDANVITHIAMNAVGQARVFVSTGRIGAKTFIVTGPTSWDCCA